MFNRLIPNAITPSGIPKTLIALLILSCLLMGLSGFRYQGLEGWLHVLENWLVMLVMIPAFTALISTPIKWRDESFDVRLAYYLGMFVALLFMLAKMRYWR